MRCEDLVEEDVVSMGWKSMFGAIAIAIALNVFKMIKISILSY